MRPPPPHGAQSAPWGPRGSGATSAERGPHRACCAWWGAIPGVFERGATQPDPGPPTRQPRWGGGGMQRRPNAAGVSPRAAMAAVVVEPPHVDSVKGRPCAPTAQISRRAADLVCRFRRKLPASLTISLQRERTGLSCLCHTNSCRWQPGLVRLANGPGNVDAYLRVRLCTAGWCHAHGINRPKRKIECRQNYV